MGRKGGIKSGESRRKKRDLEKSAKIFFEVFDKLEKEDKALAEEIRSRLIKEVIKQQRSREKFEKK